MDAKAAPGQVRVRAVTGGVDGPLHPHSAPGFLLELARVTYGRVPRAELVGVGGESLELGEGLSAAEKEAREALRVIRGKST